MLKIFTSAALAVVMASAAYSSSPTLPSDSMPADEVTTTPTGVTVTGGAGGGSDAVTPAPAPIDHVKNFMKEVLVERTLPTGYFPSDEKLEAVTFPTKLELEAQFNEALNPTFKGTNAWTQLSKLYTRLDRSGPIAMLDFSVNKKEPLVNAFATILDINPDKVFLLAAYVRGKSQENPFTVAKSYLVKPLHSTHYTIPQVCELIDKPRADMNENEHTAYKAIFAEYLSMVNFEKTLLSYGEKDVSNLFLNPKE